MAEERSFHALTHNGRLVWGDIDGPELAEGVLRLSYSYLVDATLVRGSLDAAREVDGGAFLGTWKEHAKAPIAGERSWHGRAHFVMAESLDGHAFFGTRTLSEGAEGPPERWMLDVPRSPATDS